MNSLSMTSGETHGSRPTVLVVDDLSSIVNVVADALTDLAPGHWNIHRAFDMKRAFELVNHHPPDVVLLDLRLGGSEAHGFELLDFLTERFPLVKIVIISVLNDIPTIFSTLERGAIGYLDKMRWRPSDIVEAVERAYRGEATFGIEVAKLILEASLHWKLVCVPELCDTSLTPVQQSILQRLQDGQNMNEIAEQLGLGGSAVRSHLGHLIGILHSEYRRERFLLNPPMLRGS